MNEKEDRIKAWAENWEANRRVASDYVDDVHVSTIYLGIDHSFGKGPPELYETLVFGGPLARDGERYSTREEALAGHAKWLAKVESLEASNG